MSKILILDGDVDSRDHCHQIFDGTGHELMTLPPSRHTLATLNLESIDLVLLEIHSKEDVDLSLLEKLRERAPRLPVVIYTSADVEAIEKDILDAGAVEIISKNTPTEELVKKIDKILAATHRILGGKSNERTVKLLIVDDDENIRQLLADFFEEKGFQTYMAGSGEEGISVAQKVRPNLAFVDLMLPGIDGLITLKKLLEVDPNLGVIMITGIQDTKVAQEALSLGAYHFIEKPFNLKKLDSVVSARFAFPK